MVTEDALELPVYIEDDIYTLAEKTGVAVKTIASRISLCESGKRKRSKWRRVPLEEKEIDLNA